MIPQLAKAQGCLAGLCVGDALGSQFEFMHPFSLQLLDDRELGMMVGSTIFHTVPGQITDDAEMALCLTESLLTYKEYNRDYTKELYVEWMNSNPIDIGVTTRLGLSGNIPNINSESNGALMRIGPMGIYGVNISPTKLYQYCQQDARITHDNKKVEDCNFIFAYAVTLAIKESYTNTRIIEMVRGMAKDLDIDVSLLDMTVARPEDYYSCMGHVDIAFRNALYHLRLGSSFEHAILDTIRRGGDTDTNAAICGALMGAYYGVGIIPRKWLNPVISCKSDRPLKYKTNNILNQAKNLVDLG